MLARRLVRFRSDHPPHLALYVCGQGPSAPPAELPELAVRDPSGRRTEAHLEVLRRMGIVA